MDCPTIRGGFMHHLIRSATALVAVMALLPSAEAPAAGKRAGGVGDSWTQAPSVSILQQLPPGLNFPAGLKFNPLGTTNPVTVTNLTGALTPDIVREGFTLDANGVAQPAVHAVESNLALVPPLLAFDAQQPSWLNPTYVCPATGLTSAFYACANNLITGLKIEWGAGSMEQVEFLYLGSPSPPVTLYSSADYNCNPQGVNVATNGPCNYDNVGTASGAWEFAFNCYVAGGGCANGAALQWRGTLYTASGDLLANPNPADPAPDGGPPLNQFVYNGDVLYAPPGWQSFIVTGTGLLGPRCQFTAGTSLTFYAAVVAFGLQGIPAGSVQLLDGGVPVATANLNKLGLAKFNTSLNAGTHSLTMAYQGNNTYAPSLSPVDVLVSKPNQPPAGCIN
jgi:hypothetical protein